MNKHVHRLVFDRRRGMRVPAAEHVKSAGKAGSGESRAQGSAAAACSLLAMSVGISAWAPGGAEAQTRSIANTMVRSAQIIPRTTSPLPVRSTDPTRTAGDYGSFTIDDPLKTGGTTKTITQNDQKIVINWDSFDIAKGYTVRFVQPTNGAALNNIWGNGNPSVIQGNIQANGEVILQNQNGLIFSPTARVDTGRFVATALSLANETFLAGIRANTKGDVIFGSDTQSNQGFITIERGAEIKTLAGGDVIMVAPKVFNEGRIETPSGQTVLAAGQKVYLYSSSDAIQRGLVVAVDPFAATDGAPEGLNTVEQAQAGTYKTVNGKTVDDATPDNTAGLVKKINQVLAEQGTINLVGLTVRQNGVLSATTAVKQQNGAIYLQGQASTYKVSDESPRTVKTLGTVELGAGSITSVTPSTSDTTQTSSEAFYRSRVNIDGKDIHINSGALVQAVSGNVQIRAGGDVVQSTSFGGSSRDDSTLVIDSGATITAAGLRDVALPMSRNQLAATPFQIELADSPVQRNGVVYRKEVYADARQQVTLADVTGYYNLIGRTARELSTRGGNIVLASSGSTKVADGAKLDISGGSVRYQAGQLVSSYLSSAQGLVAIEDADPNTRYTGLITPDVSKSTLKTTASYVEGANAGTLSLYGGSLYLGADVDASVVVGPLQRSGAVDPVPESSVLSDTLTWSSTLKASPWLYASLRPMGGTISIGRLIGDTEASSQIGRIDVLATKTASEGVTDTTQVSAQMLQQSGAANIQLMGDQVNMASDVALNLGASGKLAVSAKQGASLAGQVRSEGGAVDVFVQDGALRLADTTVFDVSGRIADERGVVASDAVAVNGGTISLTASAHDVDVRGATLNVSGGYWLSGTTKSKGTAGSITLAVSQSGTTLANQEGQILLEGATLSGYDFGSGGQLSLSGMRLLGIGTVPADEQAQWAGALNLSADFFSQGGFGTYSLSALGGVKVFDGTQVNARLKNWYIPSTKRSLAGAGVQALTVATLDEGLRSGVNINLTASAVPDMSGNAAENVLRDGGSLAVGTNALLDAGLGGSIKLSAGRNLELDGTLRAHGGKVTLSLSGARQGNGTTETSDNAVGYLADQEILLKAGSEIDVSGAAKLVSAAGSNRQTGSVLGGGTVNLNYSEGSPSRGFVVAEAGSLINVSGASASLNLDASSRKTTVSKGAGSVLLGSADGFSLQGTLKAERPDNTVAGGQFLASLSLEGSTDVVRQVGSSAQAYPTDAKREILLLGNAQAVVDHANEQKAAQQEQGVAQTGVKFAQGVVSTAQLLDAGFDQITLRADQQITLGAGANLVAAPAATNRQVPLRALNLTARALNVADDQLHTLQAGYVSLGSKDLAQSTRATELAAAAAAATAGSGQLNVNAGLMEVYGYTAIGGVNKTQLQATLAADGQGLTRQNGEIRFIGRTLGTSDKDIEGQLNFNGQLTLKAGSVYTTTLSTYTVQGTKNASALTIESPDGGSTATRPLSALGHLTLNANDITVNGVVDQPFGQITATADNQLTLGAHAVLSVSGDGVTVPVGTTLNGADWSYATAGTQNGVVVGDAAVKDLSSLSLEKSIVLTGANTLDLSTGGGTSRLDAHAGGDLQAWEFVKGVGGSTDVLNKAGYYAVVPSYQYDFAPYDTEVAATTKALGATLGAGTQITITTDNGVLKPGTYTLLPARYALLPGAVLVSSTTVAKGGTLAQAVTNDDGSVVVTGFQTSTGTLLGSSAAGAALVLAPQSTVLARSQLDRTSINDYVLAQNETNGTSKAVPGDAGRIQLASNKAFDVLADFMLRGGGELDLSMGGQMAVVDAGASAPTGYAKVDVDALENTGASSILIGGSREGSLSNDVVTAKADKVLWATSVDTKTELLSVAKDTIEVADGVTLQNSGVADETAQSVTFSGQSAALVLSNRVNTSLKRDLSQVTSTTQAGSVKLGKNVILAGAAVQLDATNAVDLGQNLTLTTQSLSLGANNMLLGGVSSTAGTLSLTQAQLQAMANLAYLNLRSTGAIEFAGTQTIGSKDASGAAALKSLVLDASEIVGAGTSTDAVKLTARNVTLKNTGGKAASGKLGSSSLIVEAVPLLNDVQTGGVTVSAGAQRLAFGQTTIESKGDVVFDGSGSLTTQGDATVQAARVTATKAANQALKAGGVLTVAAVDAASHTLGEVRGSGASLALEGKRVVQAGRIELPSGKLSLTGTGQLNADGALARTDTVVFEQGSITSAAGHVQKAGTNWAVSTAGGDITASAAQGQVVVRGNLDVSAGALASDSDSAKTAGTLTLKAAGSQGGVVIGSQAAIKGQAATDTLSGKLVVDARSLSSESAAAAAGTLDRIAQLANAGQMHGGVNLRLRDGEQSLDTTMKAVRTQISVDGGSLTLMGHALIDATAPQGGVVSLSARDDVVLATNLNAASEGVSAQAGARIVADSTRAGANGGDVLLSSTNGFVIQQAGAKVSALGDAGDALDGRIVLRAGINNDALDSADYANAVKVSLADAGALHAGEVTLEAVKVYDASTDTNGVFQYRREVVREGKVTQKVVTKATGQTSTTTTTYVGAGKVTVLQSYTKDASGNISVVSETVLAGQITDLSAAKKTTATTGSSVAQGTTYSMAAGYTVASTVDKDVILNQTTVENVAATVIASQASSLVEHAADIKSALGLNAGGDHLRLGVELRSDKNFSILKDWNLADLRLDNEPIQLTIRAQGDLNIKGNLSDGFAAVGRSTSSPTLINAGDAASYRLVAGADLTAADVLRTAPSTTAGDLVIGSGKVVRTTAGSIELAAGRNVVLEAGTGTTPIQGVAYVAGRLATLADNEQNGTEEAWAQFTDHGGRFEVMADGNITAPGMTQVIGNWLYHSGTVAETLLDGGSSVAWWTSLDSFKQGFGSFGGGNIRVTATGDITNVGVVAPTSARNINTMQNTDVVDSEGNVTSSAMTLLSQRWQVDNGGDVTVKAGGNINGGVYLLSKGQGLIEAGGQLAKGTAYDSTKLAAQNALLGLMDGQWTVQTRGDLTMGLVYNPTILPTAASRVSSQGLYYTYGADSALFMSSSGGDVVWDPDALSRGLAANSLNIANIYAPTSEKLNTSTFTNMVKVTMVAPPVIRASALDGGLTIAVPKARAITLFPSADGDLSLYAADNLVVSGNAPILLADTDPTAWPTIAKPIGGFGSGLKLPTEIAAAGSVLPQTGSALHADDETPVRLYAGGDISPYLASAADASANIYLRLPKAAEIEAGGNINHLIASVQHFDDQDVSLVKAGGNLEGSIAKGVNDSTAIKVAGPGWLQVEAGKDLNLNGSDGVVAKGNDNNDLLPDVSARLKVMAGANKSVKLDSFQSTYLDGKPAAQVLLINHVRQVLNLSETALTGSDAYAQALSLYAGMTKAHQVELANKVISQAFVATFVADGQPYASAWSQAARAASVSTTAYDSWAFKRFKDDLVIREVTRLGKAAVAIPDSTDAAVNEQNRVKRQALWNELNQVVSLAGLGAGFTSTGDINVAASKVQTQAPGSLTQGGIDLFAPWGDIVVGLTANDVKGQGVVTQGGGSVHALLGGDFQVNSQKAFVVGRGDLTIYSAQGSIDSGRGSNTTVSAPLPKGKLVDGYMTFVPGAVTSGSGLAVLTLPDGTAEGDVNLFAPVGGILALDTFIRNQSGSGTVNLAGPVKGADNIKASNVNGAPVVVVAGPAISTPTALPTNTASGSQDLADGGRGKTVKSVNGILTVDLVGLGEIDAPPTAAGSTTTPPCEASGGSGEDKDCLRKRESKKP